MDLLDVADRLPGALVGAVHHADPAEAVAYADLIERLLRRVGRLVFNGYPTGVEVAGAMMHGGPYPATTAPFFTAVGSDAIRRWLRPVVYQDAPPAILPPELRG
jgi:NADP-dependent aldehyde dehydrogenase